MEDIISVYVGCGLSAAVIGASSVYEYYKCRKILINEPDSSFNDILGNHNAAESILLFLGIPGYELARNRYSDHSEK